MQDYDRLILNNVAAGLKPVETDVPAKPKPVKIPHGRRIRLLQAKSPALQAKAPTQQYGFDSKGNTL
jgi:hypothetical protein